MAFTVFFRKENQTKKKKPKFIWWYYPVWVKSSADTTRRNNSNKIIKENYALGRLNLVKTFPQTHNANRFRLGRDEGVIKSSQGRRPLQWFPIHFKAKQREISDFLSPPSVIPPKRLKRSSLFLYRIYEKAAACIVAI